MPKTIVVTGATRGIGRALVDEFARLGHTIVGCGRSRVHVAQLSRELAAPHDFSAVDVAEAWRVEEWAKRVVRTHGAPDLILNNAGLINDPAPLWEVSVAQFSDVVDVNIKGVFHVARAFLPAMIARGSGVIVNLSSGWGKSTSPEVAPYCATKWAIEGLNQALAQELPRGLAAIALSPGTVHTDMLAVAFGSTGASHSAGPQAWAVANAGRILDFGPRDNGRSLALTA